MAGSYEMAGLWAVWHAVHVPSSACSRTTTCGNPGGLPPVLAWQPMHTRRGSGLVGFTSLSPDACNASGPWQASQCTFGVAPRLAHLGDIVVARDAGGLARVDESPAAVVVERTGAGSAPYTPKSDRHEPPAQHQKRRDASGKEDGDAKDVIEGSERTAHVITTRKNGPCRP